jgi:hypothetical protein
MNKAQSYALGSTAKFFRLALRKAFSDNTFNWDERRQYSNWFGKFGQVDVSGLIKANKPGRTGAIVRPPANTKPGGKLPRVMFHQIDEQRGTMFVGLLPQKVKGGDALVTVFKRFQIGGDVNPPYGDQNRMRGYLAAIGIPMDAGLWKRPARPLIKPMVAKYPPVNVFKERYLKKLGD